MSDLDSASTSVVSDDAWFLRIVEELGLVDKSDVERVSSILIAAEIRAGRPRSPHRLQVKGIYFAGVKNWRPEHVVEVPPNAPACDARVEPPGAKAEELSNNGFVSAPFAFAHAFAPGFTAFASRGTNDSGKSTVLGIILWALRGTPPTPTLQADLRDSWLREAALLFDIDGVLFLTQWRVCNGRPEGGIYILGSIDDVELDALRTAGLEAATKECDKFDDSGVSSVNMFNDAGEGAEQTEPAPDVNWPAAALCEALHLTGKATTRATFENDAEFLAAVGDLMLTRLELEPIKVWTKNRNALDLSDGKTTEHGWKTLSRALAIIDPTTSAVLGEHPEATQHLMGVYLGAKWSHTTVTARRFAKQVDAELMSLRRRRDADRDSNQRDLDELEYELAGLKVELEEVGHVPAFDMVQQVAARANAAAIAASQAYTYQLKVSGEFEAAERALIAAEHDLNALIEARATRRFFHSLRPSCCPRCDSVIDTDKWARENDGHCSLCDSEFIELTVEPDNTIHLAAGEPLTGLPVHTASAEDDDEEDAISAISEQIRELTRTREVLIRDRDTAVEERERREQVAAEAAAELSKLDQSASGQRYQIETAVARLEGRIAEREGLNHGTGGPDLRSQEFASRVFGAAERLAKAERDNEQHSTVAAVSRIVTELGIEFGIRNLEQATLRANGHLPVVKGGQPENFGGLNAGERLRLKIALIVGLLQTGKQTGTGRHPGLLIVDDLTTHEINSEDAAKMVERLASVDGLQFITASTLGPMLAEVVGTDRVVMPPEGEVVLF